jgi:hypothetical protein
MGGCAICSGMIFLSEEEPRVQVGCPNCGGKLLPIGMSEEEFVQKVLNNQKESNRQMKLPLGENNAKSI